MLCIVSQVAQISNPQITPYIPGLKSGVLRRFLINGAPTHRSPVSGRINKNCAYTVFRSSFFFLIVMTPKKTAPDPNKSQVDGSGVPEGDDGDDTNESVTNPLPGFSPDVATVSLPITVSK
jgi:hypothetical protein